MTTFAQMEALVVGQTRRPEIPDITQVAIRTATLRAHHTEFFPRDVLAGVLTYTPYSSAGSYDFPSVSVSLPRLRSFQLLLSVDAVTTASVESLEYRELQDLYTADNVQRTSMYTLIGDTLRVYPQAATGKLFAYYYSNPVTTSDGYSSWIADNYPDELAAWAAGIVFARTGFAEMAADFQRTHITPFKELLTASHLLANVH
jgi:hypothetical protein